MTVTHPEMMDQTKHDKSVKPDNNPEKSRVVAVDRLAEFDIYPVRNPDISLIDLAVVLWRHRLVMLLTVIIVCGLGAGVAVLKPKLYFYSTVLEVGSYVLPNESGVLGNRQYVENSMQVSSRLERRFIPGALLAMQTKALAADSPTKQSVKWPHFTVLAAENSNVLEISTEADAAGETMVISLLNQFADELIQDHRAKLNDVRSQILQIIGQQEVRVERLQGVLLGLQQEATLLKQRKTLLNEEYQLVESRVARYSADLNRLKEQRATLTSNALRGTDAAISLLLLENEVFRVERLRDELEVRGVSEIPQERAEIEKQIMVLTQDIVVAETDLKRAEEALARSKGRQLDHSNLPAEDNGVDVPFELINFEPTRIVVKPHRSAESVSIEGYFLIAVVLVIAGVLSIIVALLTEFGLRVRRRVKPVSVECT